MGNSQSSNAATGSRESTSSAGHLDFRSRQEKAIAGSSQPVPLELITKLSRSVCKIIVSSGTGSGFLGKLLQRDTGQYAYGLFTNNHVLNEDHLAGGNFITLSFDTFEEGQKKSKTVKINVGPLFRFTCSILDVSFIELSSELVDRLKSMNCNFLVISTRWSGTNGEKLIMLQYPGGSSIHFAQGSLKRLHGFDIFHLVSTDYGSSGSPVVQPDGVVVGIHKRRAARNKDNYNVALSATAMIRAISIHCVHGQFPRSTLICNPSVLQAQYEAEVVQLGLQRHPSTNNFEGLIYVSPATIVKGKVTVTPIWFTPTSHGWYWTPTDPFDPALETNWMSVNVLQVEGGYWHNEIPAPKNVVIINWLCNHNRLTL